MILSDTKTELTLVTSEYNWECTNSTLPSIVLELFGLWSYSITSTIVSNYKFKGQKLFVWTADPIIIFLQN